MNKVIHIYASNISNLCVLIYEINRYGKGDEHHNKKESGVASTELVIFHIRTSQSDYTMDHFPSTVSNVCLKIDDETDFGQ